MRTWVWLSIVEIAVFAVLTPARAQAPEPPQGSGKQTATPAASPSAAPSAAPSPAPKTGEKTGNPLPKEALDDLELIRKLIENYIAEMNGEPLPHPDLEEKTAPEVVRAQLKEFRHGRRISVPRRPQVTRPSRATSTPGTPGTHRSGTSSPPEEEAR